MKWIVLAAFLATAKAVALHDFLEGEGFSPRRVSGSVVGTVTTAAKTLPSIRVTFDQKICGNDLPDDAIVVDAQGHLANAVVMLVGVKAGKAKPIEPLITNEKCRFTPRVQIARPNSTIKTTSHDPVLHTTNVQTEGGPLLFNVALPVPGMTISKPLGPAGIARITCNTHPWMRGYVVVTDDIAAVTGADGSFGWSDVPAGTYELRVWHEAFKAVTQKITIGAGKATPINVRLQ
jgi:hypothetical protein